ncbi:sulfotransferase domain-containing protein [Erythrobacteraceae bacterium WH01K]|nr:sulfotransferase domain-containing protein [Erythrobacteraceae bacterium WH01K]
MKSLSQYAFDLQRFGLTPARIASRLVGEARHAPRILTVTMPKSGTNLLQRLLVLHPALSRALLPTLGQRNRERWSDIEKLLAPIGPGRIVSSHFDFDPDLAATVGDKLGYKILLMVRDPRDAVISDMHYIQSWPGHPLKERVASMKDDKTRLLAIINGEHGGRNIRDQILRFSDWTGHAHTVRFEDTVGAQGGGTDETQLETVRGIFAYLGMDVSLEQAKAIAVDARSSKTQTFRTGRIRNWETVYDRDVKDAFKAVAGDQLIELGYEKDHDW